MIDHAEFHNERVALLTGGAGFVGRHLHQLLLAETSWTVWAPPRKAGPQASSGPALEVTDLVQVKETLKNLNPDYIFHLAATTPPADESSLYRTNLLGVANLLECVLSKCPDARVLVVGSDAQYGPQDDSRLPTAETAPMRPVNAYGRSKVLQEKTGLAFHSMSGLNIICVRPFNIFGPGQTERFVLGSLARGVALAERQLGPAEFDLRSPHVERDFTDVRDVVRAYVELILSGSAGDVYNVGSGRPVAVRDLAEALARAALTPVNFRPSQVPPKIREVEKTWCDATRLNRATGWRPVVSFDETISDTLEYWRRLVARTARPHLS